MTQMTFLRWVRSAARSALILCVVAIACPTLLAAQGLPQLGGWRNIDAVLTVPMSQTRSIDGRGNNLTRPEYGAATTALMRMMSAHYRDGMGAPSGADRPSARAVSNAMCAQSGDRLNPYGYSSMVFQWGQFLDHDIDLTETGNEPFHIPVPDADPYFSPQRVIPMTRSVYDHNTGSNVAKPRQQMNDITAFIDASQVYGSDPARAAALRTNDGTGRLKTSTHDLLPYNTAGFPNAGGNSSDLFLAGDVRANEQVGLTAMHVLFVREHNRWARELKKADRTMTGDEIYEAARARVGALMQVITYNEFLPIILGPNGIAPYTGYKPGVNPSIANEFSTAAYRFGHSMLGFEIPRYKANGTPIPEGNLSLREAFFTRDELNPEVGKGIEPLLRGLSRQVAQDVDVFVVDDVRNFLFGAPGQGGFDLAALNIQRGRDHGLPSYNETREAMGMGRAGSYADISSDPAIQQRLTQAYGAGNVDKVDLWVGGLAEDKVPGALVGPLFHDIIADQFTRLRDGDRFFYKRMFGGVELAELERTTLAHIIIRNTRITGGELGRSAFTAR